MAKILLLDIETAPSLGYVWGKYDQNVIRFLQDWYILSFAYRWFDTDQPIVCKALPDYPNYKRNKRDDKALCQDLWDLLNEADIVVAHNGDNFDIKKINARLVLHGIPPPAPYKTVDTLKLARKHFKFDSNRLNDLARVLGLGEKVRIHADNWNDCMNGDMKAWAIMKEYNPHDIVLLEGLYVLLRAWGSHPDVALIAGHPGDCPTCGSDRVQRRGLIHLKTRSYQRLNCQACGSWFKGEYVKR
jgi:DNA polymerase elongation subunit (family B)